jgi:hypothetical protein
MSLLDFESSGPGPKGGKKSLKLVLGIGALAGVITLSSTLNRFRRGLGRGWDVVKSIKGTLKV